MKNYKYLFSVVIAGILWGMMSIFVRGLNELGFTSMQIMFVRSGIAAIILFFVILIKDSSLLKIQIKDIWMFLGSGILSQAFFSVCYFTTIIECGASVAVVLLYTSPIFVLLISNFVFKEKITLLKFIAIVITFFGCILVAGLAGGNDVSKISLKGLIIGLLSGLGYGLYSIFGRIALKKYKTFTVTFYSFVFASISMIPFSIPMNSQIVFMPKTILLFAGVAIFCTLLPFLLYTFGLNGLEASQAAIFATIEPLVGTLVGIFLWKEDAHFTKIIGIALIFASIILAQWKAKKTDL